MVKTAVNVCASWSAEHLGVLLASLAEVYVDELAHIEAQPVRVVRCGLNCLRAGTGHHILEQDDAEVVVRQAARGGLAVPVLQQEVVRVLVTIGELLSDAHVLQQFPPRAVVARHLHPVRALPGALAVADTVVIPMRVQEAQDREVFGGLEAAGDGHACRGRIVDRGRRAMPGEALQLKVAADRRCEAIQEPRK
ncbi:MAG TPA: hypothetical protein VN428_23040 [Bryobacteraceae bacterium]|nr:hypothetical protein [Bryobacteraceae bacterium]